MNKPIRTVAILGAGVMGARIAAHFANAGIPSFLLDIVPRALTDEEKAKNLTFESPAVRNRLSLAGLETAKKSRPAAFFTPELASLVTIGNFEDNLEWLGKADWIIEVVIEKLDIKKSLFEKVERVRTPGTIVSSNTSGLSIASMAEGRSDEFRRHFLGTHFFNPPRYMKLLEMIPSAETDSGVFQTIASFAERMLGKGIVTCKDTPNFIANRIGVFAMLNAIHTMIEDGYTVEEVDQLTGPATGKPKSATFRTGDLVGIDTLVHVAENLYEAVADDEMRESLKVPAFVKTMVERGWIGDKTKQGFYQKKKSAEGREILALDYKTLEYHPRKKSAFPSLETAKGIDDLHERLKLLAYARDRAGAFTWKTLSDVLMYAANRVPEISDDIVNIDNAMKWGFNWELGPFETWDAIGVGDSVKRMKEEGRTIPAIVEQLLSAGKSTFYERRNGTRYFFDIGSGTHTPIDEPVGLIHLPSLKDRNKVIRHNAGSSLIDLGDGVACLEFHSKMNAIGEDIIQMVHYSLGEVEKNFEGLVIGNEGAHFSVGANLMLILMAAQDEEWDDLDFIVRQFQKATMSLRYSPKPVVVAPFGMTLGGGCEFTIHGDRVRASAELYMGLVEVGVGVIPAGGGTKEILLRNLESIPEDTKPDLFPYVQRAFETIGLAKVSTSAMEARTLGLLRPTDGISMNKDHLIADAKKVVLAMRQEGYSAPVPRTHIPVLGEPARATLTVGMHNMKQAGWISQYDMHIGSKLAFILTGGNITSPQHVSEQYLLDLEREAFLSLCGEKRTQDRMAYMLKNGKPLRN
ncbi:MAG: 3-hydroxyacyl-CoA dehydrogenase [Ignavibacteria bacterium]|nr:3-hydroxyacyl-CoA dehydrogenase [Ignavibacteria bacterium]